MAGIEISGLLAKVDKIVKEMQMDKVYHALINCDSEANKIQEKEIFGEQYSFHTHSLIERFKALEHQIDSIGILFSNPEVKEKIANKRKNTKGNKTSVAPQSQSILTPPDTESELSVAEKIRTEAYLKVNSLSSIILSYQTQLKSLRSKLQSLSWND